MRRGDVVVIATGKPRPGIVVQSDGVSTPIEVLICPTTTHLLDASYYRPEIQPNAGNGLKDVSQIMVDKVAPVGFDRIGKVIGRLDNEAMERLDASLAIVLDLIAP